jgi:hypothetical protein
MRYRKRVVIVEAVLVKSLADEQPDWAFDAWQDHIWSWCMDERLGIYIETAEGVMYGALTDYLIQGVNGELYPCKPDIFAKTYDIVDDERDVPF